MEKNIGENDDFSFFLYYPSFSMRTTNRTAVEGKFYTTREINYNSLEQKVSSRANVSDVTTFIFALSSFF